VARLIARTIARITRTKAFLDSTPVPLDIVLNTPGGLVLAAIQIARAWHARAGLADGLRPLPLNKLMWYYCRASKMN
jgi:hypothetical protein